METIIFCGIQASGKSTFFKEKFFHSHARISLDLLKTRNREIRFIDTCFSTRQPFVVDNTNPTKKDREKYILLARENKFKVIGYYFQSKLIDSLARNNQRQGKENIPEVGIRSAYGKLELPSYSEGFDELYYVEIVAGGFHVKDWENEI